MANEKPINKFSRHNFGGGEAGETAAQTALVAHEATLLPGVAVRSTRAAHVAGVIREQGPGRTMIVDSPDGLHWEIETRDLELT